MSLLETWVQTPGAAALGWTLVHSLWEGAILALVLAMALCFLRASRARYAAGCLAMLGLLAVLGLTFARVMPGQPAQRITLAGLRGIPPAPDGLDAQWQAMKIRLHPEDYLPWLAPFWIAGVLIFHLRSVTSWMAARRLRRIGVCCAPDLWQARLDRLGAQLRLSRPISLLESCLAEAPVVIGYIRPVILMPVGLLAGLPAGQIEAILLHELAHIRRYDYLANLLQVFVEGLLFYHPAVWWISGVVRAERENCCDDLVVAVRGGAYEYATALTALEQYRGPRQALAANGGNLVKRIRRLLAQPERPSASLTPVFTAAILTITVVTALAAWQSKPADPTPLTDAQRILREEKLRAELESPYDKWVNEDVVYIITDEEKQAFKLLGTDEEREKFIEQFWLRRDPTPTTPENEMKQEHYRRIAYTNERFGIPTLAGWKTDRGRIYITFGPPDQRDSNAGGSYQRPPEQGGGATSTFPFEQWRYRHIDGIGSDVVIEFVDRMGTGDYRMTMDPADKDSLLRSSDPSLILTDPFSVATVKAGATLQVMGNSAALISFPLSAYGDHRINIHGSILNREGRTVTVFEEALTGPAPIYTKFIPVNVGSSRFKLIVRDLTTGKMATDTIEFEVK